MRFDIAGRHAADNTDVIFQNQMARQPACALADAFRVFERLQKRVRHEGIKPRRIRIGARIPCLGID